MGTLIHPHEWDTFWDSHYGVQDPTCGGQLMTDEAWKQFAETLDKPSSAQAVSKRKPGTKKPVKHATTKRAPTPFCEDSGCAGCCHRRDRHARNQCPRCINKPEWKKPCIAWTCGASASVPIVGDGINAPFDMDGSRQFFSGKITAVVSVFKFQDGDCYAIDPSKEHCTRRGCNEISVKFDGIDHIGRTCGIFLVKVFFDGEDNTERWEIINVDKRYGSWSFFYSNGVGSWITTNISRTIPSNINPWLKEMIPWCYLDDSRYSMET